MNSGRSIRRVRLQARSVNDEEKVREACAS